MKTFEFYYLKRSNLRKYLRDIEKYNLRTCSTLSFRIGFILDGNYYLRRLRNVAFFSREKLRCLVVSSFEISRALTLLWKPRVNSSRHISSATSYKFGTWRVSCYF